MVLRAGCETLHLRQIVFDKRQLTDVTSGPFPLCARLELANVLLVICSKIVHLPFVLTEVWIASFLVSYSGI